MARLAWAAPAAVWAAYLPLGIIYLAVFTCGIAAWWHLRDGGRLGDVRREPGGLALAALLGWLALSGLWSRATAYEVGAHLWAYALWLGLPLMAAALSADAARRALAQFCIASVIVAMLLVAQHLQLLPSWPVLASTVDATGNKRISISLLLALGAALSVWHATAPGLDWRQRGGWALVAAATTWGLAVQDRRTGMVLLPLVLLAWGLVRQPTAARRALVGVGVLAAVVLVWSSSPVVRERFREGMAELQAPSNPATVATSWGQRLVMWEITADMVRERPLVGHGIGSWRVLWRERTPAGSALSEHVTPHNDVLLVAQQGGAIAVLLLAAWFGAGLRHAAGSGRAGVPLLSVWVAIVGAGLFNAVLRDAKFTLPLVLVAACASAVAAGSRRGH